MNLSPQERRDRRVENKARLDVLKLSAGCADCGYDEHAFVLHWDHIRISVHGKTPSELLNEEWSVIQEELDCCEVVCANHHAVRTYTRGTAGHFRKRANQPKRKKVVQPSLPKPSVPRQSW